jgi:hypothetical protein
MKKLWRCVLFSLSTRKIVSYSNIWIFITWLLVTFWRKDQANSRMDWTSTIGIHSIRNSFLSNPLKGSDQITYRRNQRDDYHINRWATDEICLKEGIPEEPRINTEIGTLTRKMFICHAVAWSDSKNEWTHRGMQPRQDRENPLWDLIQSDSIDRGQYCTTPSIIWGSFAERTSKKRSRRPTRRRSHIPSQDNSVQISLISQASIS